MASRTATRSTSRPVPKLKPAPKTGTRGRPPGPGPRFEENRNRIYEHATALFARKGFEGTTMREIAGAAGISPGLTYRYFSSKEAIVLELYRRLSADFDQATGKLAPGPISRRFTTAMELKFKGMEDHRSVLRSLISAGLNPESSVYVMGPDTADIRERVRATLLELIQSSAGRRKPRNEENLGAILYVLHLALIFCWLHDPSPDRSLTKRLLKVSGRALAIITRFMNMGPIARLMGETARGLDQIFGNAA